MHPEFDRRQVVEELSGDQEGEDLGPGWMTDADTLAHPTAEEASLRRLTAPGTTPLAVPDAVHVTDRFRAGSGGLRVTLAWPAHLRDTPSPRNTGGPIRHALPHTTPAPGAAAHGRPAAASSPPRTAPTTAPAMEWHPPPTDRCTAPPRHAHTAAPASPGA
ncbi:hypothetical protein ACWEPZ_27620 [Streptomyces sp. NPDC004288]